ncbi:MAG: hypothetical protein DPW09_10035 [Anaerolineae bacterium]|nr:hypothetical protein [Anaerolineae bacterium]
MSIPILATKLYMPPPRPNLVPRPHLIEQLNEGLTRKLILISAPAGFGKTMLVSEWLSERLKAEGGRMKNESKKKSFHPSSLILQPSKIAWLSLDAGDNDPVRFFSYLLTALQQVEPDIGQTAQHLLRTPQPPGPEALMTALLNDLAGHATEFILVLDDYHTINTTAIHEALTFLLSHLPPQLHMVMTSRTSPPLPLSRLRARGQLLEMGIDALRFSLEETDDFLNRLMALKLKPEEVTILHARTEGWVTGLQLAALALRAMSVRQSPQEASGFIATFTGKDRYVGEYLLEEVFQHQSEKIRTFLRQTSILDHLIGALCDRLTGQTDGHQTLAELNKANLFIVPLDNEGHCYRYHPLFADFLRAQLRLSQPELEPELHGRAAAWFVEQGLMDQAIGHALAAQNFEQAANLIEQVMVEILWLRGELITFLNWLTALPDHWMSARPRLLLGQTWAMLLPGHAHDKLAENLQELETILNSVPTKVSAEESGEAVRLKGEIATLLAEAALMENDLLRALNLSERALAHLPKDELTLRSMATQIQGYIHRLRGEVEKAGQVLQEASISSRQAGNIMVATFALSDLGEVQTMQGKLHQAVATYQQALELAAEHNAWPFPPTSAVYVGLGHILYEWNELERTGQHLQKGLELSRQGGYNGVTIQAHLALARLKQAQGQNKAASDALTQAEKLVEKYPRARLKAYFALGQVRLWLLDTANKLDAASRWADTYKRNLDRESPPLTYLRHLERLTLARVWLAQRQPDNQLLADLLQQAETAGWTRNVIEILILQALARQAQNDVSGAMSALRRALSLAEPENYTRLFVDEGAPMIHLLQKAVAYGASLAYVGRLQASFMPSMAGAAPEAQPLLEPLTKRELEVLKLMAAGLSNREIAANLVVAMGTVAKYSNNIFTKLAVTNRTQAISRAQALKLL